MNPKTDPTIEILTNIPSSQLEEQKLKLQEQGILIGNNIDVIVKYNGDIRSVAAKEQGTVQILNQRFAVITLPPERVKNLINYTEVEYIEAPQNFIYNLTAGMNAACIRPVQERAPYNLKGNGVLLGIIDSGITYAHPDFRNPDGTTRIAGLWDQTITGNPPLGFKEGTEYSREQINEALSQKTRAEQLAIVPSTDTLGHGTHVASIAGGNGRASRGVEVGAAPEAEFVIVKLGNAGKGSFVRTVEIMLALKYVIEKARELGKPMAINLSLGMNEGSHDGQSLIEQYFDDMAQEWKVNIVVGAGNEGAAENHFEGRVANGRQSSFQFQIPPNKKSYSFTIWQNFIDTLAVQIVSPTGASTPRITYAQGPQRYVLDNTVVYTTFAGPSPLNGDLQFGAELNGIGGGSITSGIWTVNVFGIDVTDGRFNVWGETQELAGKDIFFLKASPEITVTTPSTAANVITVGAYDPVTNQIAPFSGRGFTREDSRVKPDLVAPGVNILGASNTGGYTTMSGTSMAAPHVTGAIALMMEWGIVKGKNPFLYGESVRTYLLRGTNRDVPGVNFPDPRWGYGKLCLKNTMDIMRTQQIL
ncbi:MAG: S8 family peptidase [Cellulosilyticaceae bacterium]